MTSNDPVDQEWAHALSEQFVRGRWSELDVKLGEFRYSLRNSADSEAPRGRRDSVGSNDDGIEVICAETPGVFWRAPRPGADPFTDVGRQVLEGQTLCIIEIMKMMIEFSARFNGTVEGIYSANGEQVEPGSPLFGIRRAELI